MTVGNFDDLPADDLMREWDLGDGSHLKHDGLVKWPEKKQADAPDPRAAAIREAWRNFTPGDLESNPPPQRFIWRPRIPAGKVTVLSGPGGSYKTTFGTHIAACRAAGLPFLDGTALPEGETAIFTAEDGAEDYLRKMAALRVEWGADNFPTRQIAKRVHLIDVSGLPDMRLVVCEFGQYRPTALPDVLAEIVKTRAPGVDLIIVETASRFGAGENNDAHAALISAAERLCRLTGAAVLIFTHVSQDAGRTGKADQYTHRGGGALSDNARSALVLTRLTPENVKEYAPGAKLSAKEMERLLVFKHTKSNAAYAEPLLLERAYNEHGPVLRLAGAETEAKQPATQMEKIERLRRLVERLTGQGVSASPRVLRDYTGELETAKGEIGKLITEAQAAKAIRSEPRKGRGGGEQLFANPKQERRQDWTERTAMP